MRDTAARVIARIQTWPRGLAIATLVAAATSLAAAGTGDAGGAAWLGFIAIVLAIVTDRRRRRGLRPPEVDQAVRALLAPIPPLDASSQVDSLTESGAFTDAVALLASERVTAQDVVGLTTDRDAAIACAALGALALRTDVPTGWTSAAVRRIRHATRPEQFFLLEALAEGADTPVIGAVLSQLDEGLDSAWIESLIERRLDAGETISVETFRRNVPRRLAPLLADFIDEANLRVDDALREPFDAWQREITDSEAAAPPPAPPGRAPLQPEQFEALREIGRVTSQPLHDDRTLGVERERLAAALAAKVGGVPPRSALLVGENGVGKTTIARAAVARLGEPWVLFDAGAAAVHAGAVYVGELETRVDELARLLAERTVVWLFPEFENALYTGQHARSPRGLLDALLPHIDAGRIVVVGEATPESYERLRQARPRVASVLDVERIPPASRDETEAIATSRLRTLWNVGASSRVVGEAYELAQDFAPAAAPPGNVLRLLDRAAEAVAGAGRTELAISDVLDTLSHSSGLPVALLDPGAPLDVDAVREFFEARILGQPGAVDCMVDRIALIKAGLTDPSRPLAVFLFVGPTGTGKTELAKATAEFVFGTADRLVRIDMSEFQTPDALERLLADRASGRPGAPLLDAVRRDPFSVVLLDEFEKAAPPIWDAFLQLFDDGRLTDQSGNTVDFRRCIVILTSNVGSAAASAAPLGFRRSEAEFRADDVRAAVRRAFRPEFVNRLDEIVVFRPLGREQMRSLLDKELAEVLERRGLRSRPWAVIFDDSAIDFLIDRGFSPDLGARPLKRAVETALLAPLAHAIVQAQIPDGDQFLFVTAHGGRIDVKFVDPDEEPGSTRADDAPAGRVENDLRAIALAPSGTVSESRFLLDELTRVAAAIGGDAVRARKEAGLAAIARPGFWDEEARFGVLADVEHLDRLDAALRTAQRLGSRLRGQLDEQRAATRDLAELLAVRLYVLDQALAGLTDGIPDDVVLEIDSIDAAPSDEARDFVGELVAMYRGWAERRGMRIDELQRDGSRRLTVSGLGAGVILARECGLHVLERLETRADGERSVDRVTARVEILPADGVVQRVVRRYRPGPAPLVRDAVRNYRTGRLDRVLAGDFDLF